MKKILILVFLITILSVTSAQSWLSHVICRNDNTYVSYMDSTSPRINIQEIIQKELRNFFYTDMDTLCFNDNLIFKIKYSENVDIYIVKCYFVDNILYYFFPYNKSVNYLDTNPYIIHGKWMENNEMGFWDQNKLISGSLVSFKRNCDKIMILKERIHNGTSYNAVVDHYMIVKKNKIKLLYNIESVSLYTDPLMSINQCCYVQRNEKDNLVTSILVCSDSNVVIGKFNIDHYKLKNIEVKNKQYKIYIITSSGIPNKKFFKQNFVFN